MFLSQVPPARWARVLCKAGHIVRAFSLDKLLSDTFPQNMEERINDVTDPATFNL